MDLNELLYSEQVELMQRGTDSDAVDKARMATVERALDVGPYPHRPYPVRQTHKSERLAEIGVSKRALCEWETEGGSVDSQRIPANSVRSGGVYLSHRTI